MTRDEILASFPDINEAFKNQNSLMSVCDKYIDILDDTKNYHNNLYANKLSYFNAIEEKLDHLEEEFNAFKKYIKIWSKKHNCQVIFNFRRKGFIEFNKKIRLYLLKGRNLDLIRDILGIRLILCTDKVDSLESIKLCYSLMNEAMDFFIFDRKCLFLDAEPRSGKPLSKTSEVAKKIYVPEISYLDSQYITHVKDYVFLPKSDGYQSLHSYIKTRDGFTFELQIRTYSMHIWAKLYHSLHKAERYSEVNLYLNPENIMIPGVLFDTEGNLIQDDIGLFKGIDPFNPLE